MVDVVKRGALYIGWSAGANLACPTIRTTNDMPIVDPNGFAALGLFPLQINPHFTNALRACPGYHPVDDGELVARARRSAPSPGAKRRVA